MMILRPAFLEDADALAALGRDSFVAKFGHLYSPENLEGFLTQAYAPEVVADEIAAPECLHQLAFAAAGGGGGIQGEEGALIGYCKLWLTSYYSEHSDAKRPIDLGQLYTAPERTGEGIGAALMDWALAEARARGADAMLLSVYSENYGAQRFYARYGFAKIADIDFYVGNHRDDEFLYELRL